MSWVLMNKKVNYTMSNTTTIQQAQEQVDQWIKTVGVK